MGYDTFEIIIDIAFIVCVCICIIQIIRKKKK